MANPHRGEVEFEAEGKKFVLRFGVNAICELENHLGRGFISITDELRSWSPPSDEKGNPAIETEKQVKARMDRVRLSFVRSVFWAALRDRQPNISVAEAGDVMEQVGGLGGAMALINQAIGNARPDAADTANPQTPGQQNASA